MLFGMVFTTRFDVVIKSVLFHPLSWHIPSRADHGKKMSSFGGSIWGRLACLVRWIFVAPSPAGPIEFEAVQEIRDVEVGRWRR